MKTIFTMAFALFAFTLASQTDTIITIKADTVKCKITKLTSMNIFYTENSIGKSMTLKETKYHSPFKSDAEQAANNNIDYATVMAAPAGVNKYYTSYTDKTGAVYKVGDTITIGMPSSNKSFAFIQEGDGILTALHPASTNISGQRQEIKKIWVAGNKRVGYHAWFRTKGAIGLLNCSVQVENAIGSGEIKSFGMTSDEALTELKKCKDKLDLGLITQDQYDKKKADLSKFIK